MVLKPNFLTRLKEGISNLFNLAYELLFSFVASHHNLFLVDLFLFPNHPFLELL
jgi:hypothetical protein